jgi:hypothetical protein
MYKEPLLISMNVSPRQEHRESALFWRIFPSRSIDISVKNIAQQGHGKYVPDGCFVHGRFVSTDILSPRTFCPTDVMSHGCFVPTDILSDGRFVSTDVLSPRTFCPHGRFVHGRFVSGHFVSGRFVWAPREQRA